MDPVRLDEPTPNHAWIDDRSPSAYIWPRRLKFQDRRWLHGLLLLLTIATTTVAGALHYAAFQASFNAPRMLTGSWILFLSRGLWYSLTILAILGCHELGHYLACRYYDLDASLPFFIPMPLFVIVPTGTLGAFIRIREPFRTKKMLFDIGIAGPIAGFLVAVPALFLGLAMSKVDVLPPNFVGVSLGEPLLFKLASHLFFGTTPEGYSVNLHPMAFAAWFGLLATALNLFPIGQLDGGHISYAVLGRHSTTVTFVTIAVTLALGYFVAASWLTWTFLMVAMFLVFGRTLRHPPTIDEHVPLDRGRLMLALFAVAMFVLCFMPAPISEFAR